MKGVRSRRITWSPERSLVRGSSSAEDIGATTHGLSIAHVTFLMRSRMSPPTRPVPPVGGGN